MRLKNYLLALLLLLAYVDVAQAQQLTYEYSPTGNRRQCYVGFAKIVSPDLPEKQEQYTETMDSIQFTVYPNPTKGLLKVGIDTDMKVSSLEIELYDVNGKKVIEKSAVSQEIELDITEVSAGSYFMKVFVNDQSYYWNVLKE